jgi:hypothetical protein
LLPIQKSCGLLVTPSSKSTFGFAQIGLIITLCFGLLKLTLPLTMSNLSYLSGFRTNFVYYTSGMVAKRHANSLRLYLTLRL